MTTTVKLKNATAIDLCRYLEGHEDDIAHGVNDFGDLVEVFIEVFGRPPATDPVPKIAEHG